MKYFKIIISLFLTISFLASCSMEKRVYRKGYRIDWNKTEDQAAIQAQAISVKIPSKKIQMKTVISSVKKQEAKNISAGKSFIKSILKHEKRDTTYYNVKKKKNVSPNSGAQANQNTDGNGNMNLLAVISFVCAILAMLSVILAITIGSLEFLALGVLGVLVLGTLALILGLVSISKIKANPGTYINKWMAQFGIVVPLIILFGLILFFVR